MQVSTSVLFQLWSRRSPATARAPSAGSVTAEYVSVSASQAANPRPVRHSWSLRTVGSVMTPGREGRNTRWAARKGLNTNRAISCPRVGGGGGGGGAIAYGFGYPCGGYPCGGTGGKPGACGGTYGGCGGPP